MTQPCTQCNGAFEVTEADRLLMDRLSPVFAGKKEALPEPSACPPCRERQRMSFRNEWSFYRRTCDLTATPMLSIYSPDKPYTVYEQSVWWTDRFDPLVYGRDFDFSCPFFEQWQELSLAVPRGSIHNANSENCEYTNYSGENKNCYLAVGTLFSEDALYCYRASRCKNICDCYDPYECELCYEVAFSKNLYDCRYCTECHLSSGLSLCSYCNGCQDCFGCVNLRNQKHHIFNEPHSQADYERIVGELRKDMPSAKARFEEFRLTQPHRAVDAVNCEQSSGDHMINCKDCHDVFVFKDSEGSRHCAFCENNIHCMDANFSNGGELQYLSTNLVKNYHVLFGNLAWYDKNCIYITSCFNSSNLFGCIGMKKNEYCILNKQYTKEKYEALVPRIIAHMRETGEWGKYYPVQYSPFGFNETAASVEHPLSREEAVRRGWKWHDDASAAGASKESFIIPADIADVSDNIVNHVLACEVSAKPYKITPQELKFYRLMNVPVPRRCPDQRQKDRVMVRSPHRLWTRACAKCACAMQTTYAPDRPEIVYCERCYLETVY